jgi:hypothetical protein
MKKMVGRKKEKVGIAHPTGERAMTFFVGWALPTNQRGQKKMVANAHPTELYVHRG